MLKRTARKSHRRKGQALVEYALLLAGVALTCVVAVAVLGQKTAEMIGVMAAVLPGAQATDNMPITTASVIPLNTSGTSITLNVSALVAPHGIDRMAPLLGPGGGALLVTD